MFRLASVVGLTLLAAFNTLASSKKFVLPPIPAGYDDPGPEPADVLAQIAAGLRRQLRDPGSVRDFFLCRSHVTPPTPTAPTEIVWERAKRITLFQVNSRNGFGGYAGTQDGIASFQDGRLVKLVTYPTIQGNSPDQQRAIARREPCQRVPDADILKLMSAAG